jgi:hypothetical protein
MKLVRTALFGLIGATALSVPLWCDAMPSAWSCLQPSVRCMDLRVAIVDHLGSAEINADGAGTGWKNALTETLNARLEDIGIILSDLETASVDSKRLNGPFSLRLLPTITALGNRIHLSARLSLNNTPSDAPRNVVLSFKARVRALSATTSGDAGRRVQCSDWTTHEIDVASIRGPVLIECDPRFGAVASRALLAGQAIVATDLEEPPLVFSQSPVHIRVVNSR